MTAEGYQCLAVAVEKTNRSYIDKDIKASRLCDIWVGVIRKFS